MIIVKIGGGMGINLEGIVEDLVQLEERLIIVHGANSWRNQLAANLGKEVKTLTSLSGFSSVYSDDEMIDIMLMAYSGLRNKRIVECCQRHGMNAVGLTGLDGKLIRAKRNAGIRISEGSKTKLIRDLSGRSHRVNGDLLELLMNNGFVPVITVPALDENNMAVNTENDDVVTAIQAVLPADRVVQLIEASGFLQKPADPDSIISNIPAAELILWEERSEGRIKRKLRAIRLLFDRGVREVIIADGRKDHPVSDALLGRGTVIK